MGLFFGEETKTLLFGSSQKCLRQWSEWNFWMAINAQYVTRVGTVFLVKFHGEHLPEFFIAGQGLRASIQQLLRDFWFGAIARKGACTVMSR